MFNKSNTLENTLEEDLAIRINFLQLGVILSFQPLARLFNTAILQLRHEKFIVDMKTKLKELK